MKSRIFVFVVFMVIAAFVSSGSIQQSAEQLFQSGIYKEDVEGKLEEAIAIYEEIIKKYRENRPVAAKTLYHLGSCYEKLGLKQAQEAFQRIVDEYPEQTEIFGMAKEKLSGLLRVRDLVERGDQDFRMRKIGPLDVLGAPSPDGKLISFVDWDTGDLAVLDVGSGKERRVTNKGSWAESSGFAEESIFSPDGKSIAYNWCGNVRFELRIIAVDGTNQRTLYTDQNVDFVWPCSWTPDGRHILAVLTNDEMLSRIALISASDGAVRTVKEFKSGSPGKLWLSPDGQWIAYDFPYEVPLQDDGSENRDIFLLAADGRREIPLMTHPGDDRLLGWSSDGRWILFSSDRSGTHDAWIQSVEDGVARGNPQLVRRDFGGSKTWPMGFTRDGSFYYGLSASLSDIYIVSLDPSTGCPAARAEKAALRFEGSNSCPCWSPDGTLLAYTSSREQDRSKPVALCIKSMISGEERELYPEIKDFDTVAWFPDGKSLLVRGVVESHRLGLFRVDLENGKSEGILILDDMQGLHGPVLFPDGKKIFYDLDDFANKTFRVIRYDLETKQKKELIRGPSQIIHYDISPDGKWLAYNEGEAGVGCLRLIPAEGGEKKTLLRLDKGEGIKGIVWSPDGRAIYFSKWGKGSSKSEACSLWRIPAEGGKPEKYDLTVDGLGGLSFRPDGKKLAFSSWSIEAEVWVMENFLPVDKVKK